MSLLDGPEIQDLSPAEKIEKEIDNWKKDYHPDDYIRVKGTDGSEVCLGRDDDYDHLFILKFDNSGNILEDDFSVLGGDFDKITVKELENSYKLVLTAKTSGLKEELYDEIELLKSDFPVYEELYSLLKNAIKLNYLKLRIDGVGFETLIGNDMGKIRIENLRAGKYSTQLFSFNKSDVSTVSYSNDGFLKHVVIKTKDNNEISFKTTDQNIGKKLREQYLI